jgi:hypothetical protein
LFDKTTFEIPIAAKHAKIGHSVKFIPSCSKEGKRSADLLIDNYIEIECKKKDYTSKQEKRNIEYWNQMGKKLFEIMNYIGHNYSIVIKSEKYPTTADVKFVTNNIRSLLTDLKDGTFSLPNNGIDIILQKLLPLNTNTIEHKTSESFDY